MLIFDTIKDIKTHLFLQRQQNKKIGFVPTMGALHAGHLSLIAQSTKENDITVCSIYVNPTQFNNLNDLQKYPRTFEKDKTLLEQFENIIIFFPSDAEMYQDKPKINFNFGYLESVMEGKFRPGHFNGVALIVSKLFHIIQPQFAYFGQKDLQQCMIIKQLVKDLSFDLEIIIHPTIRESDGLAMSSRNQRLNESQRKLANTIPRILFQAKEWIEKEHKNFDFVIENVQTILHETPIQLEYFEIVNADDLQVVESKDAIHSIALCIAVWIDDIRLLDNIIIKC